ncbi:MAG TPA: hypothetical protein VEW92_08575 [Nitrososphaeraceae archaeon]|nr:hypothetical protein [Nitrososphaeraceae archaeon]
MAFPLYHNSVSGNGTKPATPFATEGDILSCLSIEEFIYSSTSWQFSR